MKKITVLFAVAGACLLAACAKINEQSAPEIQKGELMYITAIAEDAPEAILSEDAKGVIGNSTPGFKWTTGDQIAVFGDGAYHKSNALEDTYDIQANATFSFSADAFGTREYFAVYPARLVFDGTTVRPSSAASYGDGSFTITLPASYNLSEVRKADGNHYFAPMPQVATNTDGAGLSFKQLGAALRFKLQSVPKQTQYITFDFNGKKVQGEFTISGDVVPGTTALVASATDDADDIITVYNDGVFSTFQTDLQLTIPVPTGTYTEVTVTTWDGQPGNGGHKINALTTPIDPDADWAPARKDAHRRLVQLPVYAITVSNGIGAGIKVVFAPGNLRATLGSKPQISKPGYASSWSFAPHQYEVIGTKMPKDVNPEDTRETYNINSIQDPKVGDVIDLFAWVGGDATGYASGDYTDDKYKCGILYPSGSDIDALTGSSDNYSGLLRDWGQNVISTPEGDYPAGTWRTLTKDEWYKVLVNRGGWRLRATITDGGSPIAYGYMIAPDQYTHPAGVPAFINATTANSGLTNTACADNVYTLEQWEKLEGAGCVFFPITNVRTKGSVAELIKPADGWYWSTLASTSKNALCFAFNEIALGSSQLNKTANTIAFGNKSFSRKCGAAVRLVRVVND